MAKKSLKNTDLPKTFAVVGNGASLTEADVKLLDRPDVAVIAVNDAWRWAPWAFAIYSADYRWWDAQISKIKDAAFAGRLFAIDEGACAKFDLEHVKCEDLQRPLSGLSPDKQVIRHGYSGGFQAMQIARGLGAERILLLGFDYGATGQEHAVPATFQGSWSDFQLMLTSFDKAAPQLKEEGTEVINCTRETNLTVFPRMTVKEALA